MDKPNWIVLKECGEELTKNGITTFTRQQLIKCVQSKYPDRGKNSLNSMIQRMTVNLKGGAPGGKGRNIFFSVGRGLFKLYDEKDKSKTTSNISIDESKSKREQEKSFVRETNPTEVNVTLQHHEPINGSDILDVLIMEYNALRDELVKIFDREVQIFSIVISALGVIYGIIFAEKIYDLILFIPILISPLALKFKYGTYAVGRLGKYLFNIDNNIRAIIKSDEEKYNIKWIGWQHYWEWEDITENKKVFFQKEGNVTIYDVSSKWLLFIIIPVFIAFLYSRIIMNPNNFPFITSITTEKISHFDNLFHIIIAFIYMSIIVFSGLYLNYKIYKNIVKPKI
jgi:hypothetical protein